MTPLITGQPLPPWCQPILSSILESVGCLTARVTSVGRWPRKQAEVMFGNCMKPGGPQAQLAIYKDAGDAVIRIFIQNHGKIPDAAVISLMTSEIAINPDAISHHCREGVFDIAENSIPAPLHAALEAALSSDPRVSKWLHENGCWHIELKKAESVS